MNDYRHVTARVFRAFRAQAAHLLLPATFVITIALVILGPLVFETLGVLEQAYLVADRSLFGSNEASNPPGRVTAYLVWFLYAAILIPAVAAAVVIVSIAVFLEVAVSSCWNAIQPLFASRSGHTG